MAQTFRTILLAFAVALSGRSVAATEERPLVHEGVVSAPIESVWDALTSSSGQEAWMVAHAEVDLRIGGLMRSHYDPKGAIGDSGTIENTILCLDPKHMLSFRVSKPPEGFPFPNEVRAMWTVIYLFAERPNLTRIRIVGLGFSEDENSQKMRQFFDRGNAYTLKGLQDRFASKTLGK